ncbi:MAG: ABC transporter permease [Mobilitalea sp.]
MADRSKTMTINKGKDDTKRESNTIAIMKRLSKNHAAMIGLGIFLLLVFLSIISTFLTPYDYAEMNLKNMFASPSWAHPFGTDELGRDILTRILYGGRYSLSIGVITVAISASIGCTIGAITGYFGGTFDTILMRFLDIIQAIPGLLLTICIASVFGAGFDKTIIALSISSIPQFVRILRASVFGVRNMEYLEAASSISCSKFRIITRYVIPNSMAPVIVQITMDVARTILTAASLSFIGLGVQPPLPEWGAMLAAGRSFIRDYPYLCIFPGVFIMTTVLGLNMFGDGLRDALDPKLKN